MSEFAGGHVLVTGASSGIGLAAARMLAARGARVSLIARSAAQAHRGRRRPSAATAARPPMPWPTSPTAAPLLAAIEQAERAFGPVAGLFANAGTGGRFAPLCEYDDDVFEAVLRTNLTSVYWAIKRVLPGDARAPRGSIVVTGSLASERGMPHNVAYVASKHAVLGLARAAAVEAAPHNVRVNCVVPGFIETPMLMQLDPSVAPEVIRERARCRRAAGAHRHGRGARGAGLLPVIRPRRSHHRTVTRGRRRHPRHTHTTVGRT